MYDIDFMIFLLVFFVGVIWVGILFFFVSLGECLIEKGGCVNLGLEGILVCGVMIGYVVFFYSGLVWLGVLVVGCVGFLLGVLYGVVCLLLCVNDIVFGIVFMLLGMGLVFFLGKFFI